MNRRQRLQEVVQVCRRGEVTRLPAPPDWAEWGRCGDCGAVAGQPCYDVLGSTRAMWTAVRLTPHPGRPPALASESSPGGEPR